MATAGAICPVVGDFRVPDNKIRYPLLDAADQIHYYQGVQELLPIPVNYSNPNQEKKAPGIHPDARCQDLSATLR